jgi:hypothetical protein
MSEIEINDSSVRRKRKMRRVFVHITQLPDSK